MNPNVHALLNVPAVTAIVGNRIYKTVAPQDAQRPYIVMQVVASNPGVTLSCAPDNDDDRIRISSYSNETSGTAFAWNLAKAIREAVEAEMDIVFGPVDFFEEPTRMIQWVQDVQAITER